MTALQSPATWQDLVHFRLLTRDDLKALEWDGEYIHFRRLYHQVYQAANNGKALMWGVELRQEGIIGQLFIQLDSGRKELADGAIRAYLYGFRLKAPFRNLGIGALFLEEVESDLALRRYRYIVLNVSRQNKGALRFYKRHGYKIIAPEPGRWSYLDHKGRRRKVNEPAWRMQKEIV